MFSVGLIFEMTNSNKFNFESEVSCVGLTSDK